MTSPDLIMIPAAARQGWRVRWAERENERRRHAYDAQVEAWRRRNDHLIRLRIEAHTFLGYTQPRAGLPMDLDDDEPVYRLLPAAELVEARARHVPGLPAPGLTLATADIDPADRALPNGFRVVDAGMVVITDRRVIFAGRAERREWTYADMLGPAHHPDAPLTLLHATDASRLAGLRVPAAATVNFRFYLTLAFAAASGQRAAVAAQLDALLAAEEAARPVPPSLAEPDRAPLAAARPDRRAALVAAAVALAFATLTSATAHLPERAEVPYRANAPTTGVADPAEPPHVIAVALPTTRDELVVPVPATAPAGTGTTRTPTTARAAGEVASTRSPAATGPGRPAPPAVPPTDPKPAPPPATGRPRPTDPAPPTAAPPVTAPAPTTEPPTEEPVVVIDLCLDVLRLPLADRLLCPQADPTS
ncbi:hypothetical protein [Micromonospora sp. CPCC 205556]|uniref:hypothetical protein n=1 Tax=Micromonospora sp. CPCC 205556 TaxID=3122398 RepID=UPI002FF07C91